MSRGTWTDERLDDLNVKVDEFSRRTDARFNSMQQHMDARFEAMQQHMDARFEAMQQHMDARFNAIDARFDAMQRLMIQVAGGTIAAFLAGFAGLIATQL